MAGQGAGQAAREAARQAVTANRLADGAVVYLTLGGGWSEYFADCRIGEGEDDKAAMMALAEAPAAQLQIVGPYLIDVIEVDGNVRPVALREHIRAQGPTVRTDLGKQTNEPMAYGSGTDQPGQKR